MRRTICGKRHVQEYHQKIPPNISIRQKNFWDTEKYGLNNN